MILVIRPKPDTRPIGQPQPASLALLPGHFQPFFAPNALYTLVVHMPAFCPEQCRDPQIPVASVLAGKFRDPCPQPVLLNINMGNLSLGRSRLSEDPADTAF
jgi:hypothetical protein